MQNSKYCKLLALNFKKAVHKILLSENFRLRFFNVKKPNNKTKNPKEKIASKTIGKKAEPNFGHAQNKSADKIPYVINSKCFNFIIGINIRKLPER